MIRVIYKDGTEDLITQKFLDILLHLGEVQMFRRNNDWAVVGVDPVRNIRRGGFSGQDRRAHQQTELPELACSC